MKRGLLIVTAVTAAAGAGVAAAARRRGGAGTVRPMVTRGRSDADRWHSVTINRTPEQLGPKPAPLDELDFPVQIRVRPAPGGRGTEVAVRAEPGADRDMIRHLRRALREARSLAEVGEVLLPDAPATTHPTVTGAPLTYATRHGHEEGRL
ncbi:hypothetical protein AB0K00_19685 [Dactylosporangium sp. NPDC049525]|uniref:hypothetical protein n=1 Tax=Dactylosporangium sp. NPDC049525 TaxID=3154730 RepID=UPI00343590BA